MNQLMINVFSVAAFVAGAVWPASAMPPGALYGPINGAYFHLESPAGSQDHPPPTQSLKNPQLADLQPLLEHPLEPHTPLPRLAVEQLPKEAGKIKNPERRKELFLKTLLPVVLLENERLERKREKLLALLERHEAGHSLLDHERTWLYGLAQEYKVTGSPLQDARTRKLLKQRVDIVPVSLALAQSANETGWGRSLSARRDHNLFGFRTSSAKARSQGLKARGGSGRFLSVSDAVHYYMHTLNTHNAYRSMREIRAKLRQQGKPVAGTALADGLVKYSSLGRTYIKRIKQLIAQNDLERLNRIRLAGVESA